MGLLREIGHAINNLTGVTSSSAKQFEQNMALQKDAQNFTKWQMGNAHQMEVQDLLNAHLNPILSAGGDGAGGTPSMGSTSPGVAGGDPISMITTLINTANNSAKTNADIKNQTAIANAEIEKKQAEINKLLKDAGYTQKQIEYYNEHGVFPGASTTTEMHGSAIWGLANGGATITEPVGLKGGKVNPNSINSAKKHNRIVKDYSNQMWR